MLLREETLWAAIFSFFESTEKGWEEQGRTEHSISYGGKLRLREGEVLKGRR